MNQTVRRQAWNGRALLLLCIAALVATHPSRPSAQTPPTTFIIDNGTVQLGINAEGHLNVPGTDPSSQGTSAVGLRYIPTNGEAAAPACLCEGWGVANADTGTGQFTGYADRNFGDDSNPRGVFGLNLVEAVVTQTTGHVKANSVGRAFRSVVTAGSGRLRVTHDFHPSAATANLYEIDVKIENIGGTSIGDLRYRRDIDFDVEPTAFNEYVEIHVGDATKVIRANTNGFKSPDPLADPGPLVGSPPTTVYPGQPDYFDGPSDQGVLVDLGFGSLAPAGFVAFKMYYGASADRSAALGALDAVDAEVYSLGIPTEPTTTRARTEGPNVFALGFTGVGGTPITTSATQRQTFPAGTNVERTYEFPGRPLTVRFDKVIRQFDLDFTTTTVTQGTESARLATNFPTGTTCMQYATDGNNCVRHTAGNAIVGGVSTGNHPLNGTDYEGKVRLEMRLHTHDGRLNPGMAQDVHATHVETSDNQYDKDILVDWTEASCNCMGGGETDSFSDFLLINKLLEPPNVQAQLRFLPPFDKPGQFVKQGRTVPLKFRLKHLNPDGTLGASITDALAFLTLRLRSLTPTGTDEVTEVVTSGPLGTNQFRYDATADHYLLNLKADLKVGDYIGTIRSNKFTPHKFIVSVKN